MKMMAKDAALIGLGAMMVLAYQKYNEPVMDSVNEAMDKVAKKANQQMNKINNKLEEMK